VLEFVPGSGKTEQLLYDSHTYYRISVTEKWVCTEQKCYKDGSHSTDTLIFLIRKTSPKPSCNGLLSALIQDIFGLG